MADYFRGNFFANTPDILHEYLQHGGRPAFRARLLLAGTLSPLYGIYSGFELSENVPVREGSEEYLDSEKYQVRVRDWGAPGNLDPDIARLNQIRRSEPALQASPTSASTRAGTRVLFYLKGAWGRDLLCAVSLNPREPVEADAGRAARAARRRRGASGTRWRTCSPASGSVAGTPPAVRFDPAERAGYIWRVVRGGGGDG